MTGSDWVDLVIAGTTAALLTFLEIDRKFRFPDAIQQRGTLRLWSWGFVGLNFLLAALLYPLAIQAEWIHGIPNVFRGVAVGAGYLSIVRQKFMSATPKTKDAGEEAPIGLEYLYESVKRAVHERINRIAVKARSTAVRDLIATKKLGDLGTDARIQIQNDALLSSEEKTKALNWLVAVLKDAATTDEEKATTLATFVLFGDR